MDRHRAASCLHFLFPIVLCGICSCFVAGNSAFTKEECEKLRTVPDSCLIDTLGITGAIFPKGYVFKNDTSEFGNFSSWTPAKPDIMVAEELFRSFIKKGYPCIDSNYYKFYRQYAGKGTGGILLIHGIRKSYEITVCGYRSFWIDIYDGPCSSFYATVFLGTGNCEVRMVK